MNITLMYASAAREVHEQALSVDQACTLWQALEQAGWLQRFPEIGEEGLATGIWNHKAGLDTVLREGLPAAAGGPQGGTPGALRGAGRTRRRSVCPQASGLEGGLLSQVGRSPRNTLTWVLGAGRSRIARWRRGACFRPPERCRP
jgi:RnfH family Ubiquitin